MAQMVELAGRENASVIGVMPVPAQATESYGIVESEAEPVGGGVSRITRMIEKPKPGTTTSTLAVVGRYVLSPRIFHHLRAVAPGAGGEIQLTDAIAALLAEERVLAYEFEGRRYDCGSKLGYLEATVDYALRHPEVGAAFAQYLNKRPGP
jgi:UTP--glucose-1-phosphate uridylyltransferase